MKTKAAALLVTLALLLTGAPAQANHAPLALGHWPQFEWPGFTPNGVRVFYVVDRLGAADTTGHQAVNDVINHFRSLSQANGVDGIVPAPVVLRQDAYAGNCDGATLSSPGNMGQSDPGKSYMLLCGIGGSTSVTWTAGGHFGTYAHPVILLQRQYSGYAATWNMFYHELLHALGSEHVTTCGDLLQDSGTCGPLSASVQLFPSAHSINSLNSAYINHPSYA